MRAYDAEKLYREKNYHAILSQYASEKHDTPNDLSLFAGFVFTEGGMALKALQCFEETNPEKKNAYYGQMQRYIGLNQYALSNYKAAEAAFEKGIECSDAESLLWKRLLFPQLVSIRETKGITFRFVDSFSELEIKRFIAKSLTAFNRIVNFLGGNPLKKNIDIYIYSGRIDGIGNSLSYADNGLKVIHIQASDACGHEIAHILFNSVYPDMCRTSFIDEGIATLFDEEGDFKSFLDKRKCSMQIFDAIQLWKESKARLDSMEEYYFAGAFVGYLLNTYGREKFLEFIEDQRYENALNVFGESIDEAIFNFHREVIQACGEKKE